jgi:hypothetical protein
MLAVAVLASLRPTLLAVDSCTRQHANLLVPGQIISGLVAVVGREAGALPQGITTPTTAGESNDQQLQLSHTHRSRCRWPLFPRVSDKLGGGTRIEHKAPTTTTTMRNAGAPPVSAHIHLLLPTGTLAGCAPPYRRVALRPPLSLSRPLRPPSPRGSHIELKREAFLMMAAPRSDGAASFSRRRQ